MNLKKNPFLLLHLSLRDDKFTIAEQYQEKISEGEIDEVELMDAQKNIMASKTRLRAELSWLPDLNPQKAGEIANLVRNSDYIGLKKILSTLDGLALANVASYLCLEKQGTDEVLKHIFEAQSQFDTATLLNIVNSNRSLAGFPMVDRVLIEDTVPFINSTHAEAAMVYISTAKHPGKVFTKFIEKCINKNEITPFIDELSEKYNSWVITKIRDFEDLIRYHAEQMKQGDPADKAFEKITELLKYWDEYSQPLQLYYNAKGLDEKRSKDLFDDMRDICLWLANEKGNYELSLKFTQLLREIFPELPSVVIQIDDDIQSLEELVDAAKKDKALKGLLDKYHVILKDPESFCISVMKGNFGPNGTGAAGDLYLEFKKAVKYTKDKEHEEVPWIIIRNLAIYLNNEVGKPNVAEKILITLANDSIPSKVKVVVARDIEPIKKIINKNAQKKVTKQIFQIAFVLAIGAIFVAYLLNSNVQPYDSSSYSSQVITSNSSNSSSNIRSAADPEPHSRLADCTTSQDCTPENSITQKENSQQSLNPEVKSEAENGFGQLVKGKTNTNSRGETKPPAGTNNEHNLPELRYCIFQKKRLDYIINQFPTSNFDQNTSNIANLTLLWDELVVKLNALIDDYNTHCGSYKYLENDLSIVKGELLSKETELVQDAQRILTSWGANLTFE